jgi:rod shape-determining protein MreD
MGYYLALPFLIIVTALQSSLVPQFRLFSGQPDFVLLLVVSWAIRARLEEALFWAFLGGIMQDLLSITPLGTSSIGLILIVFLIDLIRKQVYQMNLLLIVGFVLGASILQQLIVTLVLALTGRGNYDLFDVLRYVLLPEIFYNLVLLIPVYIVVRLIQRRIYPHDFTA